MRRLICCDVILNARRYIGIVVLIANMFSIVYLDLILGRSFWVVVIIRFSGNDLGQLLLSDSRE